MRTAARHHSRRQQRGAAFVESVPIAGLFVLFFALMLTALGFFRTKLDVMGEARQEAWSKALDPCGGSGIFGQVKSQALGDVKNSGSITDSGAYNGLEDQAEEDSGYVTVDKQKPFAANAFIGGTNYEMRGKMHVRCNEDIQKDSLWELTKAALGIAKDSLFKK